MLEQWNNHGNENRELLEVEVMTGNVGVEVRGNGREGKGAGRGLEHIRGLQQLPEERQDIMIIRGSGYRPQQGSLLYNIGGVLRRERTPCLPPSLSSSLPSFFPLSLLASLPFTSSISYFHVLLYFSILRLRYFLLCYLFFSFFTHAFFYFSLPCSF